MTNIFLRDIILRLIDSEQQIYLGVAQLVARYLGVVEAAGSSPVTQTSSEVHNEPPNFLYFTGFFGLWSVCTASKTFAIFLLKIGSKSGTTTCLTTYGDFCTFQLIFDISKAVVASCVYCLIYNRSYTFETIFPYHPCAKSSFNMIDLYLESF